MLILVLKTISPELAARMDINEEEIDHEIR